MRKLKELMADTRAATAVEYGLICACIFCAAIAAIVGMGHQVVSVWNNVSTAVVSH